MERQLSDSWPGQGYFSPMEASRLTSPLSFLVVRRTYHYIVDILARLCMPSDGLLAGGLQLFTLLIEW